MEVYDYLEGVKDSVRDYIEDEIEITEDTDFEELEESLNEQLWVCDSVTGNASGSFTFNSMKAERYLYGNSELIIDAIEEQFYDKKSFADDYLNHDFEKIDVMLRCYVLPTAISEVLEEIQ